MKGNGETKKDIGKWCNFHKIPRHNTDECHTKQSPVAKLKVSELDPDSNIYSDIDKGKHIIDVEPSATIVTTKIHPKYLEDPEEGEFLFQSQMWVKDVLLHFIVDNGIQKNLISTKVVKKLMFPTTPHRHPYNIKWLSHGQDLCINQQCHLPYTIKPFKDEVLCDIDPLDCSDVLLGQPYMWKRHDVYESPPHSVIINLGKRLHKIPELALKAFISLISAK
jgi:hypothetical protein